VTRRRIYLPGYPPRRVSFHPGLSGASVPTVTIVLLNWNSAPVVFDAAASALAQRGVGVDLLIVDNGSTDDSLAELRRRFPGARFLEMGWNSGFTGGMNAGTAAARGDYVLWQNADLVLDEGYCAEAVREMEADGSIGAMGGRVCRLVDGKKTDQFDASGYTLSRAHRALFRPDAREVIGVSGSCPLLRIKALKAIRTPVGYVLDPTYFTYGEDIDVMLRLNLGGWRVVASPAMRAWHIRSGSSAAASRFYEKSDATQVRHLRNRLATIIKTWPAPMLRRRLPILALVELALPFYLLGRRPQSLLNWVTAWKEVWRDHRRLLSDRRAIQSHAAPEATRRLIALLSAD